MSDTYNNLTARQQRIVNAMAHDECEADSEWRSLSALVNLCLAQGWENIAVSAEETMDEIKAEKRDALLTLPAVWESLDESDDETRFMTKGNSRA